MGIIKKNSGKKLPEDNIIDLDAKRKTASGTSCRCRRVKKKAR